MRPTFQRLVAAVACIGFMLVSTAMPTLWGADLARGGQFKDLILPMPVVDGLESDGLWGDDNVLPREKDNGIEAADWCYWGGNPIIEADGKYHMAICRWPEQSGHTGWHQSEIAHCVSARAVGPYKVDRTILEQGHNPEVLRLQDGTLALHLSDNRVHTSDKMAGPWTHAGSIRINSRGFRQSDRAGSNLTTELRPDGSILIMKKDGDVAVSRTGVTGPYEMVAAHNYARATGYAEDPVVWRSLHQYHAVYNHAQDRRSAYMRSLDGIHWRNEPGKAYDNTSMIHANGVGNRWHKFERPKIIQDELGRATHLTLAVLDVDKSADKGGDNHSSKNLVLPLVVERQLSIEGLDFATNGEHQVTLRVMAEEGFDPNTLVDVGSLRVGGDDAVNCGSGAGPVGSRRDGNDLLVDFNGDLSLHDADYDLKLLGATHSGELVVGYALLPHRSADEASLIALPLTSESSQDRMKLSGAVENWGLQTSASCKAIVIQHDASGEREVGEIEVPPLDPYQSYPISISISVDGQGDQLSEFRVVLEGDRYGDEQWRFVDDTESAVRFRGHWRQREKNDPACYMGNEQVSTQLGDEVTFKFTGSRARVFGTLSRLAGSYAVYLDGEFLETVRCNYGLIKQVKLYQTETLEHGPHVLRLVKTETEHNGEVSIDAFAYEAQPKRE